jgi:hypothetical protein
MRIVELILDEETDETTGVFAVSLVERPAIQSNWVAFADHQIKFANIDKEKRMIMGAAMIPDKPIYRRDDEGEYHVYFNKSTVQRCMELFFINGFESAATFEHVEPVKGVTVVESWIKEDAEKDKSMLYNIDVPVGTWMITMKVHNDVIWEEYVKEGVVQGFSIEGMFADRMSAKHSTDDMLSSLKELLSSEK